MLDKKISVVIPVFNQLEYTKRCLEAVWETTSSELCEVIVVDDVSTDETPSYLKSMEGRLRWVRNEKNGGFGYSCNQGAKMASGEYLVFLNNDTKPLPKWIEYAIGRFKWDPAVGIVGSKLLYPDGTIQHAGIQFVPTKEEPGNFPMHRFRGEKSDFPQANQCEEVDAVTAACLFIPRDVFLSLGGFPEKYGMYFEDIDLNMQVKSLGKKVIYEPRSVVIHYEGGSGLSEASRQKMNQSGQLFYAYWGDKLPALLKKSFSRCPPG